MSSLESKIDLINHHFSSCSKCNGNADDTCNFLADSGASLNFTNNLNIPPEDDGHNNNDADDDDLFPSPAPENWHALA